MGPPESDELLRGGWIGLRGGVVGSARKLVEAIVAKELVASDPLACPAGQARVGHASGDPEAIGEFGDGVKASALGFARAPALVVHGNTLPAHGWHLHLREVLPKSCYTVLPMSC